MKMKHAPLLLQLAAGTSLLAAAESFDYIIVGAGTCGLAVANRLSEDPLVTVAVIEPGTDQRNNVNVTDPALFSAPFGSAIDWLYTTLPQSGAAGQTLQLHQGKAWGGTSTINGMTYIRGDAAEFDAWEELGSKGWNWAALEPYFHKSEKYILPTKEQVLGGVTYETKYHGFDGPVHVSYVQTLRNNNVTPLLRETWKGLSIPLNPDPNSGHMHGLSMGPQTIDRDLNLRYDSATAYLHPVETRPNLKIIKGTVKRITWASTKNKRTNRKQCKAVANGVEYLTDDGASHTVEAKREVVVSAGTVRTPLVLESSGIGNPALLSSLGIDTVIDLPAVGENYIEQTNHILAFFSTNTLDLSTSAYHTFLTAADLFGEDLGAVEKRTGDSLHAWAQAVVDASGKDALDVAAVESVLQVQHDLIFRRNVTIGEIIHGAFPENTLATNYWYLLPFSRGSVHLKSKDKIDEPAIDPRFFTASFDMEATIATGKFGQKFFLSKPLSDYNTGPRAPGADILPNNASNEQWTAYLQHNVSPNSHGMGTAAMMARELGGVVDHEVRVYGTANVRVVDSSVIPMQISGHMTGPLYALAERASDIIKKTPFKV